MLPKGDSILKRAKEDAIFRQQLREVLRDDEKASNSISTALSMIATELARIRILLEQRSDNLQFAKQPSATMQSFRQPVLPSSGQRPREIPEYRQLDVQELDSQLDEVNEELDNIFRAEPTKR